VVPVRVALLIAIVAVSGCRQIERFPIGFNTSPYDQYLNTLRSSGIATSDIGRVWIESGSRALKCPRTIRVPTAITEDFSPSEPRAVAYRFTLHRGDRLLANIEIQSDAPVAVFADLFSADSREQSRPLASSKLAGQQLLFEPSEDGEFVIRIQPELLRGGRITTAPHVRAALLFPVPSVSQSSVQSLYGASRESGRREHQGIDIFAPRGSPAIAAAAGLVTSTSPNRLGGNVVWLWDIRRGQRLYYAHLDRLAVSTGQWLNSGETIGYVGNTGNARTTAPHLHFGIYRQRLGPVDPLRCVVNPTVPTRIKTAALGTVPGESREMRANCEPGE
jgi:peptidoglycan LD-endopeptidase LytH